MKTGNPMKTRKLMQNWKTFHEEMAKRWRAGTLQWRAGKLMKY